MAIKIIYFAFFVIFVIAFIFYSHDSTLVVYFDTKKNIYIKKKLHGNFEPISITMP